MNNLTAIPGYSIFLGIFKLSADQYHAIVILEIERIEESQFWLNLTSYLIFTSPRNTATSTACCNQGRDNCNCNKNKQIKKQHLTRPSTFNIKQFAVKLLICQIFAQTETTEEIFFEGLQS